MEKRFDTIEALLNAEMLVHEYADTVELLNQCQQAAEKGWLTKAEFLQICKWKDRRQLRRKHWLANSDDDVHNLTHKAFVAPDEARRMLYLCRLQGVHVPVASAILTLTNPQQYGVIDIRVWQVLHLYGEVDYDPRGNKLGLLHWLDYLDKLRGWAGAFNVSARTIERTLFQHHRQIQTGTLY